MVAKLPTIKNLVRLSLLERVSPELLVRFLRPFEEFLTARQVTLDGVKHDHAWVGALHEVLITVDSEMPGDLQQALLDVADLGACCMLALCREGRSAQARVGSAAARWQLPSRAGRDGPAERLRRAGVAALCPRRQAGAADARQSFKMLCVRVMSENSPRTLSRPRRRNCRSPRGSFTCPNTGSTMALRRA